MPDGHLRLHLTAQRKFHVFNHVSIMKQLLQGNNLADEHTVVVAPLQCKHLAGMETPLCMFSWRQVKAGVAIGPETVIEQTPECAFSSATYVTLLSRRFAAPLAQKLLIERVLQ